MRHDLPNVGSGVRKILESLGTEIGRLRDSYPYSDNGRRAHVSSLAARRWHRSLGGRQHLSPAWNPIQALSVHRPLAERKWGTLSKVGR